jgi:Ras-related protein Rab-5C
MSIAPNSDANPINVHVWDTAGQERYAALVPYYSRGADALVFVYDVTIDMSFDNLETWISVVEGRDAAVPGFIVGNKVDLADDETEAARGVAFATYKDFGYARTSAHTGMGIDDLFRQIAAELAKRPNMEEDVPVIGARPTNESGRMCICE